MMGPEPNNIILRRSVRRGIGCSEGYLAKGVAEQHAATNVCRKLVGRLGLLAGRRGRPKGTIALACAPGERHGLATTVAADIFRVDGKDWPDLAPMAELEDIQWANRDTELPLAELTERQIMPMVWGGPAE